MKDTFIVGSGASPTKFTVEYGMVGDVRISVGCKIIFVPAEHLVKFMAYHVIQHIGRTMKDMSDRAVLGLEELEEGDPR